MLNWMTTFATVPQAVAWDFHTKAIDLDGSTEYMENWANNTIWIANAWTIWIWAKSNRSTANEYIYMMKNTSSNNDRIDILNRWNDDMIRVFLFDSAWTQFKLYNFNNRISSTNEYIVLSWDGTNLKMYRDWVEDTTPTKVTDLSWTMSTTWRQVTVWSFVNWWGNAFQWLASKVDVWDTNLASNEIVSLTDSWNWFKHDSRNSLWNYTSTSNLKHQWALWKDTWSNIWADYVASWNINISDDSVNVSDADIVTF